MPRCRRSSATTPVVTDAAHARRALGRAELERRDRLSQPLDAATRRARRCCSAIAPREGARRAAKSLKPKLVGDRDLAADPPDQSRARDVRRQRRHQAGPGALLRPGRRLAAAGAAAPAGDGDPLSDRRHQGPASTSATPSPACRPASRPSSSPTRRSAAAFITVTEPKGYLGLTQFGAVEFHLWGCHIDDPEHPDRLVMDLDPDESLPWARVCDGGGDPARSAAGAWVFAPFLRTTGGKGAAPGHGAGGRPRLAGGEGLRRGAWRGRWPRTRPACSPPSRRKERRKGRIYLDYLRNGARRERGRVLFAARPAGLSGGDADRLGRAAQAVGRRTPSIVLTW